MKKLSKSFIVIFVLISQISLSQEEVEKHPLLTDKFTFTAGSFFPKKEIALTVDGQSVGDEINWGDTFDIKSFQSTFSLAFDWRFKKKWKLSFDVYSVSNVTTATLDEPIYWEDLEFRVGVEVEGGLTVGVIRTMVGRILSMGQKHEFGVGIGFHVMYFDTYLRGEANIEGDDEEISGSFETGSVSVLLPLPDIGLWYWWAPTSKWLFAVGTDWLYLSIDDYKGYLWDAHAGVNYQVVKFFGVGLKYRYYTVDVAAKKYNTIGDFRGNLKLTHNGPMVLVNFNF